MLNKQLYDIFFAGTHQNIFVLAWKEEMIEQGKQGVIQI